MKKYPILTVELLDYFGDKFQKSTEKEIGCTFEKYVELERLRMWMNASFE